MPPADPNNPNPPAPPANPPVDPRDKKIAELEGKIESMGGELSEVTTALGELTGVIKDALAGGGNPPANPPTPPTNPPADPPANPPANPQDPTIKSLDVKTRADIVAKIESKYGYDKLPEAERKELRKKVETKLNQFGTSVFTAPPHQLESLLEDTYLLSDIGKAKEQGRLEGLVDAHVNDMGAMPTMSNTPANTDTTTLSADQQELANKWGLNTDKVAGHLKELQEKGVITYKPKEQRQAANQPSPSGTPTPPETPAAS